MELKYMLYHKRDNIATISLNKPEKLNTLLFIGPGEDAQEFFSLLDSAAEDDDVKVVIIKGEGRAFCAGADLTKTSHFMGSGQPGEVAPSQRERLRLFRQADYGAWMNRLFLHPKITVAQVHGHCCDGGCVIMCCCDFAIAAEDAVIGFPGQRIGRSGGTIAVFNLLESIVGLRMANDLLYTGRKIDGKEAERIGLANRCVAHEKLEEEVWKIAKSLSLLPRDGIAIGKARRHLAYESLGLTTGFLHSYVCHALFSNMRYEPDEVDFFKDKEQKGAKEAYKARDARYESV